MRILIGLTYYRPHISGLTIFAQRLAEGLAARGHAITVLTSRYQSALATRETLHGVEVVRVRVAFRVSKGVFMPAYLGRVIPLLRSHDVVLINLPNTPMEAVGLALLGRLFARPLIAIHHCDVQLASGALDRLAEAVVAADNQLVGLLADRVTSYTADYAEHSRFLSRFRGKLRVIPPPTPDYACDPERVRRLREQYAPSGEHLIGFAARFAREKGIEFLLEALPAVESALGPTRVLFVGEHESVLGEAAYRDLHHAALRRMGGRWCFLGPLPPEAMADFYAACDATVLPSVNATESFGLVQVESMLCGTPVVASDLPGVRAPVVLTGMGRIVPPRDPAALAEAIVDVVANRPKYLRSRQEIERHFSLEATLDAFEALLGPLLEAKAQARGRAARIKHRET